MERFKYWQRCSDDGLNIKMRELEKLLGRKLLKSFFRIKSTLEEEEELEEKASSDDNKF